MNFGTRKYKVTHTEKTALTIPIKCQVLIILFRNKIEAVSPLRISTQEQPKNKRNFRNYL